MTTQGLAGQRLRAFLDCQDTAPIPRIEDPSRRRRADGADDRGPLRRHALTIALVEVALLIVVVVALIAL